MEHQAQKWVVALEAWEEFIKRNPQLGYRFNYWTLQNFLRFHRSRLVEADVIRKARNKFWLADRERFNAVAFDLATGHPGNERTH